jgi:hypothetical protein
LSPWPLDIHFQLTTDAAGIGSKNHDSVRQQRGFVNVVPDDQNAIGWERTA